MYSVRVYLHDNNNMKQKRDETINIKTFFFNYIKFTNFLTFLGYKNKLSLISDLILSFSRGGRRF